MNVKHGFLMANSLDLIHECSNKSFTIQKLQRQTSFDFHFWFCFICYVFISVVDLCLYLLCVCVFFTGTRVWEQSKVQRGEVHHRAGSHDQGQRVGVTPRLHPVFFWPWNDLYWTAWSVDHPAPPVPTPTSLLQETPSWTSTPSLLHVHTSTCSSWNWTEHIDDEEVEQKCLTDHRSPVVPFKDCVFSFAAPELLGLTTALSLSTPDPPFCPPPNHAYKWLWWYGDHYAKETDFAEDISLFSLIRPSSETNDFDDFR